MLLKKIIMVGGKGLGGGQLVFADEQFLFEWGVKRDRGGGGGCTAAVSVPGRGRTRHSAQPAGHCLQSELCFGSPHGLCSGFLGWGSWCWGNSRLLPPGSRRQ